MHHDMTQRLHLHSRGHVEALARHLFKNDPVGLRVVDAEFAEHKIIHSNTRSRETTKFYISSHSSIRTNHRSFVGFFVKLRLDFAWVICSV